MSIVVIPQPENLQPQCPLFHLPGEIRNRIYHYCFTAPDPIVDPAKSDCRTPHSQVHIPAITLLRTCRFIYHEADRRPLLARNTFRFTSVNRVSSFLNHLRADHAAMVRDIEIDARKVHSDHPGIAREWLHYLAWGGGPWAKILGSLRMDAPGLQVLRLNVEAWPAFSMFRAELWSLLCSFLLHITGLERVMVIGMTKEPLMETKEPWSSTHFVGGEIVGSNDLLEHMARTVGRPDGEAKVVRWQRKGGNISVEIVTKTYLLRNIDPTWNESSVHEEKGTWPEQGSCSWSSYKRHRRGIAAEAAPSLKDPIFSG